MSTATQTKKTASSKKTSSHPPFADMIFEAILNLKERTGSSQYAIAKFIEEKHKDLPATFKKLILQNLKKSVAAGKLVKVKNSFKLAPTVKAADSKKPKTVAKPNAKAVSKAKPKTVAKSEAVAKPKAKVVSGGAKAKMKIVKSPVNKKVDAKPVKKKVDAKPVKKKVDAKPAKKTPVKRVKKTKSVNSPVKKVAAKKVKK
ncbi:unnamed protein product [Lupinus luteus]|uniref:H15 domain-containing protein n=1 Tax=Lupinus luteus TaxID=3873 RepID=A0AAV1VSS1_LUPLU